MFRTALIRTAAQASRVAATAAARPAVLRTVIAPATAARAAIAPAAPRWATLQTVRMYSAGGSLNKEEVEGRIIGILQGFDKVSRPVGEGGYYLPGPEICWTMGV